MKQFITLIVLLVVLAGVAVAVFGLPTTAKPAVIYHDVTPLPLPPTPNPTSIVRHNGTMTIGDIQHIGILATAQYSVTGDIGRDQTYTLGKDSVSYHVQHLVVAGVDLSKLTQKDVVVTDLPDGYQRIDVKLPPSEIYWTEPTDKAGVTSQQRNAFVLWLVPFVGNLVPINSGLVNQTVNDGMKQATSAACKAGITTDAAYVAAEHLTTVLKLAGFKQVNVTPEIGQCAVDAGSN